MRPNREVLIAVLIAISIALIALDSIIELSELARHAVYFSDLIICLTLAYDFVSRVFRAHDRIAYVRKYWYEVIALLPAYLFLIAEAQLAGAAVRLLRMVRVVRILRLSRVSVLLFARSAKLLVTVSRVLAHSKIAYLLVLELVIVFTSSTAVYAAESGLEASPIKSFFDAVWWAFTTITTVGYGDVVPVTAEGKGVGLLLMAAGIIIWSAIVSLLTVTLIEKKYEEGTLHQELRKLIKKYLDKQETLTVEERTILRKLIELTALNVNSSNFNES